MPTATGCGTCIGTDFGTGTPEKKKNSTEIKIDL